MLLMIGLRFMADAQEIRPIYLHGNNKPSSIFPFDFTGRKSIRLGFNINPFYLKEYRNWVLKDISWPISTNMELLSLDEKYQVNYGWAYMNYLVSSLYGDTRNGQGTGKYETTENNVRAFDIYCIFYPYKNISKESNNTFLGFGFGFFYYNNGRSNITEEYITNIRQSTVRTDIEDYEYLIYYLNLSLKTLLLCSKTFTWDFEIRMNYNHERGFAGGVSTSIGYWLHRKTEKKGIKRFKGL